MMQTAGIGEEEVTFKKRCYTGAGRKCSWV